MDLADLALRIGRPDLAARFPAPGGDSSPPTRVAFAAAPPAASSTSPSRAVALEVHPISYQRPGDVPWGAEPFYVEGRALLPIGPTAASAAATASGTAAAAVENASGVEVADTPTEATVAEFFVPARKIAVVTGWFARPFSTLGYELNNVTFGLALGGARPVSIPTRLLGVRGSRGRPFAGAYTVGAEKAIRLLGSNASPYTWHGVEGYIEGWFMDEALFRKTVSDNV